jgi:AraC-like DNA-binding protein
LHYVKTHFHEQLSAARAASLCGTTRFAFSRDFHAAIGMTFREYAMRARIAEARRLLAEGCNSITEVAYATGFTDGSHFARMFKRYTRVLPSEYRESRTLGRPTAAQPTTDPPPPDPATSAPAP